MSEWREGERARESQRAACSLPIISLAAQPPSTTTWHDARASSSRTKTTRTTRTTLLDKTTKTISLTTTTQTRQQTANCSGTRTVEARNGLEKTSRRMLPTACLLTPAIKVVRVTEELELDGDEAADQQQTGQSEFTNRAGLGLLQGALN